MDTQNPSAPPHAQSRPVANKPPNRRRPHSSGGLLHDNIRHTERFTVIGNHLAQHPELSLLAIGLGVHLQSLPRGAQVDIKTLTGRFPEGATRIATALRELEDHGYLRRKRERVPDGRIITRTISCNQPRRNQPGRDPHADREPTRSAHPTPQTAKKKPAPRKKPLPAVPQPGCKAPALVQQATDLLADLHRHDSRLLLSACDTAHLTPGVAAWLERDVTPSAVRHALISDLPDEPLRRPAALLAHRLTAQLPPLPPLPPFRAPAPPPATRHPFQNCDGCNRVFRSPTPGRCRDCRIPTASAT